MQYIVSASAYQATKAVTSLKICTTNNVFTSVSSL